MKLVWLTDTHLNVLDKEQRNAFYAEITSVKAQAILISGDIAEANSISGYLVELERALTCPIYFVLGNHDFYGSNVASVTTNIHEIAKSYDNLVWLTETDYSVLTKDILLVGVDGWADGRYGDYAHSHVVLNDSRMITDLFQKKCLGKTALLKIMQDLANKDASRLRAQLEFAIKKVPKKIIVVTHVPPFAESCAYKDQQTDNDFLPFFSSKATGDVLLEVLQENTKIDFLVLCGHTHEAALHQPLNNLTVKVGGARYGRPKIVEIIELNKHEHY
jgi:predicted phosphohydrolase